ncbi:unnamed protein product [Prunus armeniaca]
MARSDEGKKMGIHAGLKGASPPGRQLHTNIPRSFGCFCLKLVPSHVLEPPSSSAHVDLQAPFVAMFSSQVLGLLLLLSLIVWAF